MTIPAGPEQVFTLWTYGLYIGISILLTVWVALTLRRNGRIFLVEAFLGNEKLADSVNHLLVVGFYLVNIGYVALALTTRNKPVNESQVVELLSRKVGLVLLVLGAMHFFNLLVFTRMRRRAMVHRIPPPVRPVATVHPPVAV
jgi:hypothetical protein